MPRIMTSLCVSFVRMCTKPLFEDYCYVNEARLYNTEWIPRAPSSFFVQLEAGKLLWRYFLFYRVYWYFATSKL